jgi:hypothetical protein
VKILVKKSRRQKSLAEKNSFHVFSQEAKIFQHFLADALGKQKNSRKK